MAEVSAFLLSPQPRARWMRLDTAQLLKRFFFCERSLLLAYAAWIPRIASLDVKIGLALFLWQNAETAHALRNRVFELRFPSRLLEEEGADRALIELFAAVKDAPSPSAFLLSVATVLLPALRQAYEDYLQASDSIADGPTHRFLRLAAQEKAEQIAAFQQWAEKEMARSPQFRSAALAWTEAVSARLGEIGGVGVGPARPPLPHPHRCPEPWTPPFPAGPPAMNVSGPAASTGLTWSILRTPTAKACSCSFAPPSAT